MINTIEDSIKKIGAELDLSILSWMLSIPKGGEYKQWELLSHPVDNMLQWQIIRDASERTFYCGFGTRKQHRKNPEICVYAESINSENFMVKNNLLK